MKLSYLANLKTIPLQILNPNNEVLGVVNKPKNAQAILRFNNLSELTFEINKYRNGKQVNFYDLVSYNRLIKLDNIGVFVIKDITIESSGKNEIKKIKAYSFEITLANKKIPYLKGTYKLYDPTNINNSLMGILMGYLPNWTIDSIDESLWDIYRTFDIENEGLYSFIIGTVQSSYECIFRFDTINKKIKVEKFDSRLKTDVYLSFNNVLKELNTTLLSDRFFTALEVKGAGDVIINQVNPLGTSIIYNLDYYLSHTDSNGYSYMSDDLKIAWTTWQTKYNNYTTTYGTKLTTLKTKKDELLILQNELYVLQGELNTLDNLIDARNQTGQSASELVTQRNAKKTAINNKKITITTKESEISTLETELNTINTDLKFSNNFTNLQLQELDLLINVGTYVDETFAVNSIMTDSEKQQVSQDLFDKALRKLSIISKPIWNFNVNALNLFFIEKFQPFYNQLELGCEITISDNTDLYNPILLEVSIQLDNPTNVDFVFSETLRKSDTLYDIAELIGDTIGTEVTVTSKFTEWMDYVRNDKAKINTYMTSGLRADVQEITNSINQEVTMNERGILCRLWLANESDYDNRQLKITANKIMMTKDNWETAEFCLGEFTLPDNSKAYGLLANVLIGNMVIGNNLLVENSSGTFSVNKDGMTVTSMTMTLTNASATNRILLNGTDIIKVQKKVNENWVDNLKLDNNGDLVISNYSTTAEMNSAISVSATQLQSQISGVSGNVSTLTQTVNGINTRVSTAEGSISTLNQTATSLQSQITDINGDVSTVTQTANGLSVAINNTKVTIDSSVGITIKNGGLRILNNSNDEVFRITSGGAIEMQGELYNLYGQLGVRLYQGKVDFTAGNSASTQTWFSSTVGSIYGYYYDQITSIKELIIAGYNRTSIKSSYNSSVYYQMNTVYNSSFIGHDFYGNIRINNYITFGGKQFRAVKAGNALTSSDFVMVGS